MQITDKLFLQLINDKYISLKTSFEDEGASFLDVLFLKGFCDKNNIEILLKIGGAEAISDIKNANKFNITKINAPMIESRFALEKFVKSIKKHYTVKDGRIFINIESKQSFINIEDIMGSKFINELSGITVGRGDLVQSYGLSRYDGPVNSEFILDIATKVFLKAKKLNLICTLGGSMSYSSKSFVHILNKRGLLDYFETRNVIISCKALEKYNFNDIIKSALQFELGYLTYKSNYYNQLIEDDTKRIKRLSQNV